MDATLLQKSYEFLEVPNAPLCDDLEFEQAREEYHNKTESNLSTRSIGLLGSLGKRNFLDDLPTPNIRRSHDDVDEQ